MATKKKPETLDLRIEYHTPNFMMSGFATNIAVQNLQENFKIFFYELKPDLILSDRDREDMRERGTVRADCIGSFIVSPSNLRNFIRVMKQQLSKYDKQMKESKKSKESKETSDSST